MATLISSEGIVRNASACALRETLFSATAFMASLPPTKRLKTSSGTSLDAWLDAFLTLDRFSLDAVQICTRSFMRLADERLTGVCLRRLENLRVDLLYTNEGVVTNSASLFSGSQRVDIKEQNLELFVAKLECAALSSTVDCVDVDTGNNANIGTAAEILKDVWSRIQVQCLNFCTDQHLQGRIAHDITDLTDTTYRFDVEAPADAGHFPLSDDGIVEFLFGNPELKLARGLAGGYTSVTANIFKRLVQAHLNSDIVEDISLDLDIYSFNPQEKIDTSNRFQMESFNLQAEVDTTGFDENLLDYGYWACNRCDSSVQYEFPGEIRLQIVLLRHKLLMRRGKRRGWKYMSREEREKWLEDIGDDFFDVGDFYNCPENEEGDDEDDDLFIGHSDYTD